MYKGGPIAIGSARFHQGFEEKPDWLPVGLAACEGPPLELGLAVAHWLGEHHRGDAHLITLFTPAEMIAEDAGEQIVTPFLEMAKKMGFGYLNKTEDVVRLSADGIEFASGASLEAEIKIVIPDWVPHPFLKDLSITDERGFVLTDKWMRSTTHPEVFAVGKLSATDTGPDYRPETLCFGDTGGQKGFYIYSDTWYGGHTSVFKMGWVTRPMQ